MSRRWGNLFALAGGLAAALLLCEAGVRWMWRDAPVRAGAAESLPLAQVRDPRVLYRLIPNARALYGGTEIQLNALGLRDRDYLIPAPPGSFRVLVLGDSMVFGLGVPADRTLPAQLAQRLHPAEAINAGVFGYNLKQEISLLRDVGLSYQPQVVVSCFVHNDIDNWGLGDEGAVPEIKSSRFEPPPDAWSSRLASLMLPGTFDDEHLNLLPAPGARVGVRAALASWSRLYLFSYVRLRTHAWNLTSGESRDPLIDAPTCRTEEVIWDALRDDYRLLRGVAGAAGARLTVVIQGGLLWEGGPLARLHRLLETEKIPFLDLTPVWLDPEHYAREHSLGWDPHPNAKAHALSADLIGSFLESAGMLPGAAVPATPPGPHDVIEARPDLRERLQAWRERQRWLLEKEGASWKERQAGFSGVLDFNEEGPPPAAQVLYGFWDRPGARPLPEMGGPGLWMSGSGAVLLKGRPGARSVAVELGVPAALSPAGGSPASLTVTFSAPPARCRLAAKTIQLSASGSAPLILRAEVPQEIVGADPIEVGLAVDRTIPASHLAPAPGKRDPRMVSVRLRRIALE